MFNSVIGGSGRARARKVSAQLERLYPRLVEFTAYSNAVPPGAEWMLDNHFVIRRAARQVRTGLGRGFERRLPHAGELLGRRIEHEARAIARETEGMLDRVALARRVERFGVEQGASLAELWALPQYLRLILLEQLAADAPELLSENSFDHGVDHRVANCVRSLLLIEKTDWARFFEQVSEVHAILSGDPSGHYPRMDFETRDRYRRVVESLARRLGIAEAELARRVVELAERADPAESQPGPSPTLRLDPRRRHVGYYLLDDGRSQLGVEHDAAATLRRRTVAYVGGIVVAAVLLLFGLAWSLRGLGTTWTATIFAVLLGVVPAWTVGVTLINWLIALTVDPRPLAKLDFAAAAVPSSCRTLLVVPGLLIRPSDADALLERIEAHFLATRDPNIELALLTDFGDAQTPETDADAALLEHTRAGLRQLNERYAEGEHGPFHLFHRRRVWSERQGRWMGWERKRGKLEELNRLLRGSADTSYVVHEGREGHFGEFRYVITLDADTTLPIGAAQKLIETLAHPLNVARFDQRGRTVAGYTVLQPRVDIAPDPRATRFSRVYAGDGAFDIYTRAVSDVYQDLFGEGVFVGKGIYDLDAFRASLEGQLPSDRVLSHDLLEGVHGRAGLVTDVVVYEDYPSNYIAYARRLHRWIRGDWQLLPWIGRKVPTASEPRPNRLSPISRWKILDNLRRSTLIPSLVAFAAFAWSALPGPAWLWTLVVVLVMAAPMLAEISCGFLGARLGSLRPAVTGVLVGIPRAAGRWGLGLCVMVHEAAVSVDAIARALVRTKLTGRMQLEWTPAAVAGRGTTTTTTLLRAMVPAVVFALAIAVGLALMRPDALLGATPLLVAWIVAPALVAWTAPIGRSPVAAIEPDQLPLDPQSLRRLARRTWAFFERVVGPEDHWLPPDHFQEHPKGEVAHRTSPTNIAMSLLSTVAAHELGYFDLLELVIRLRNSIESLGRLPRHHGHFYNWCDTTTLAPLEPRYVSTVDSGNLAVALLLVEQSCRELSQRARPFARRCQGLCDSLDVFAEELDNWGPGGEPCRRRVETMRAKLEAVRGPMDWLPALESLDDRSFVALDRDLLSLFEAEHGGHDPLAFEQLRGWAGQIHRDVGNLRNELAVQLPWLSLIASTPGPIPPALSTTLAALRVDFERLPTLAEVSEVGERSLARIEAATKLDGVPGSWRRWLEQLAAGLRVSLEHALALRERLVEIANRAAELVASMDFRFLYDRERELMFIGYDASAERYDEHHYDLLASEARIASLVATAKGEVPLRHWAKLGRPVGRFGSGRGLLSWSGTMFEYLMPPLVVDEGEGTLLDVSVREAVREQIEFGRRRRVPWGVSESGYARLDSHRNYQYRAFGVAATGFRRELERDVVIAPYACVMALRYEPAAVAANLERIFALGGLGPLGVYEALDFTRTRLELGQSHAVVRSYMAHHQGMIMLALHGELCQRELVARAHRHPLLRSVELLLRERPPGRVPLERPQPAEGGPLVRARVEHVRSWPARGDQVEAHLIGNGTYAVLLSADGAGHSSWRKLALTQPSDDPVLADDGFAIGLRELDTHERWSFHASHDGESAREVVFSAHGARISVHRGELLAELEVSVALDTDAELRIVRLTERGARRRRLSIHGFAELALTGARAHARHPAFSRLFVQSQLCVEPRMIICRRRPREPGESSPWFGCMLISDSVAWTGYETDRVACLGRSARSRNSELRLRSLPSMTTPMRATLDTCVALGGELELGPLETSECAFVLLAARSRAELIERAKQLQTMAAVRRTAIEAEHSARARAEERGETTQTLARYQRLLSAVVYPRPGLRAQIEPGEHTRMGQPGLWRYGISGDWPMLVVRVGSVGMSMVAELIHAHGHWRRRGLAIDLIFLEEQALGYGGDVRQRLLQVAERERAAINAADGGVFLVPSAGLGDEERELLVGVASLLLDADVDDVDSRLDRPRVAPLPLFEPEGQDKPPTPTLARPDNLLLDNGYGGFSPDGRAYVVDVGVGPGESVNLPPAPWINVLANPQFGCIVSERGSGYTWSGNAGLNRLTAWSNDALFDPPSESLYLRDELDGEVWSPLPAPAPARAAYQVRHEAGQTSFVHLSHGLRQRVELFVDPELPVKYIRVTLENIWLRRRRLTATLCVEWLLGGQRPADTRLLTTDFEPVEEVALAHNPWNPAFAGRWAFAASSHQLHGMTGSREEFFGRAGSRAAPAALGRIGLSGEVSHGPDACAALQIHVELAPDETVEFSFVIGQADDRDAAVEQARRCRSLAWADEAQRAVAARWDALLDAVEVRTPDLSFDLMCNRWLLYQCIASRLWGRTGFYQSSGGFGFRDQLQDVLALVHAAPELTRAHLLDAARRQYDAGDVQHWWHPPTGQGLRSRCSDDLLWLPLVAAQYVAATGDLAVLDERAPLLESPPLAPGEIERYESEPHWSGDASLYEHCMLALQRAQTSGAHGLPLIGSCDWNDGFSRVGIEGRGESVWLGWFYATVAREFAAVCERVGNTEDAESLRAAAAAYVEPLDRAWDGAWFRRAYDDGGAPIGSADNDACKIDSLAQSWGVISGLAAPDRAREAMASAWDHLVVPEANLVRLFAPAFASHRPTLGYIETYPPGVRENGGQYTHAAVWVAWAFADLGEHDRAHALWSMIVPTAHTRSTAGADLYRVEPYAIAADVYAEPPHVGRGGWTWYTGAAGWAYRMAVEKILGLRRVDGRVVLDPRGMPSAWPGFELIIREGDAAYRILVTRESVEQVLVDGVAQALPIELPPLRPDEVRTIAVAIPGPRAHVGRAAWSSVR